MAMRRSSVLALAGAVLLGLVAVLASRSIFVRSEVRPEVVAGPPVVVSKQDIPFGEKLVPEYLEVRKWSGTPPAGTFTSIAQALGDGNRATLRPIAAGEPILVSAISGGASRLASSTFLVGDLRAITVPVTEVTGTGGFVAPGDRVDIVMTKTSDGVVYADVVAQSVRVIAVGQIADSSLKDPQLVKSATLAATPDQALRIALARAFGELQLVLRPTGDESQRPFRLLDANRTFGIRPAAGGMSGPVTMPYPAGSPSGAVGSLRPDRAIGAVRPEQGGVSVAVIRGTEPSFYRVPR